MFIETVMIIVVVVIFALLVYVMIIKMKVKKIAEIITKIRWINKS